MSKEIKKKKNKGFTLIEILVAVLILAILVAIALPTYNRAVEKSRTSDPINTLKTIAKAEQVQRLRTGEYSNQAQELDMELKDYPNGNDVSGDAFDGQYYAYKVYGEEESAATATRKGTNEGEDDFYELSVDYNTGELFCRPAANKTCIDLGLDEGQKYNLPKWEQCSGQVGALWASSLNNQYSPEERGLLSCKVRSGGSENPDKTDFDFCYNRVGGHDLMRFSSTRSIYLSWYGQCMKGNFSGNNRLSYCVHAEGDNQCNSYELVEKLSDYNFVTYSCTSFNLETGTCNYYSINAYKNGESGYVNCNRYNSSGVCTNCSKGGSLRTIDCSTIHRPDFDFSI